MLSLERVVLDMCQEYSLKSTEAEADIQFYFVISYSALNFSENIQLFFAIFPKNSNSNSIFYPSMEYLTTKILYHHPNWKHVASLNSKGRLTVLASLTSLRLHWAMENRAGIGYLPRLPYKRKNTKCKMKSTLKFRFLYQQQWPAKQTVSSILNFFEDNEVVSKGLFCNNSLIYMYIYIYKNYIVGRRWVQYFYHHLKCMEVPYIWCICIINAFTSLFCDTKLLWCYWNHYWSNLWRLY